MYSCLAKIAQTGILAAVAEAPFIKYSTVVMKLKREPF